MPRTVIISVLIAFSLVIATHGQANSWRGLTPLRSTINDIERELGKPIAQRFGDTKEYQTDEGRVTILFTSNRCDDGWDVPKGTVLSIRTPGTQIAGMTAKEIGLLEGEQFLMATDVAHFQTWIDPEKGLEYGMELEPHGERLDYVVKSVAYGPSRSDNRYRCDGFPPYMPERYYSTMYTARFLDPDRKLRNAIYEHVAQIDNLMIQVLSNEQTKGYVVVYFDNKRPFSFYEGGLRMLKKRIRSVRADYPPRLVFVEGGIKDQSEIQYFVIRDDALPPAPRPTIPSPQFRKRSTANRSTNKVHSDAPSL